MNRCITRICKFNLLHFLKRHLPRLSYYYLLFGFYIAFISYCYFYILSHHMVWGTYLKVGVLYLGLSVAVCFVLYITLAHSSTQLIMPYVWHFSIFYFLFFVGSLMILVSGFGQLQVITFMINVFLAILIYSWYAVLTMTTGGLLLSVYVFQYFEKLATLQNILITFQCNFVYVILFVFILLGGLIKYKQFLNIFFHKIECFKLEQKKYNMCQFYKEQQADVLYHETNTVLEIVKKQLLSEISGDEVFLKQHVEAKVDALEVYFKNIFDYVKHNLQLMTDIVNIDQLLHECIVALQIQNSANLPYITMDTHHSILQCEVEKIKKLIINGIKYCECHCKKSSDVTIHVGDTQLGYKIMPLKGRVTRVNAISFTITTASKVPIPQTLYKVGTILPIKVLQEKEDLLIMKNKQIVDFHYGHTVIITTSDHIIQTYVIPINVQQVSNLVVHLLPAVSKQVPLTNTQAIQAEQIFIKEVKKHEHLNVNRIIEAMDIMKKYYSLQLRKSGEPFYTHPLAVAQILLTITTEQDTIIAGLLHDVVKHTNLTEAGLLAMFGSNITSIILNMLRLHHDIKHVKPAHSAWATDFIQRKGIPTIQVALADTLHNARTLGGHSQQKQLSKITEIIEYYVPLAKSIGLTHLAEELLIHAKKIHNYNNIKLL